MNKIFRLTIARGHGRMMTNLFGDILPSLVGPRELVGLAQQRVEILGTRAVVRRRVRRDHERGHVDHAIERVLALRSRVDKIRVLELFA